MNAKILTLWRSFTVPLLTFSCVWASIGLNAQTPTILTQPQSQTVDYGTDVSLTVNVNGPEPLYYQWKKYARNLSDYENIAGAHTSTLNIIGAANGDTGDYQVIISNAAGCVTSAVVTLALNPVVVFRDTFESGLLNWRPLFNAERMVLNTNRNHTPGGAWSAHINNASQAMYHNIGHKLTGRARLNGWMYDAGGTQMACLQLQGYEGAIGYTKYATPKALGQTIRIGIYCPSGASNGMTIGETPDPTTYQAWIFRGTNRGWFNLNATNAPHRSTGWHQFTIDRRNGGVVEFYVDGVQARRITGVTQVDLDTVIIGSSGQAQSNGAQGESVTAWFDDVAVENFPQTFDSSEYSSVGSVFPDWMVLREVGSTATQTNGPGTKSAQMNRVHSGRPSGERDLGRMGHEWAGLVRQRDSGFFGVCGCSAHQRRLPD
jgi:hypothetical protein